jgi:N-carbamoyl-L-amino-acid hydrolase
MRNGGTARNLAGKVAQHVNGDRLWDRLMVLSRFGATERGGVNRQALSDEEIAARAQLMRWAEAIGLEPSVDALANLFLRYKGTDPALPAVLIGSHIDSQPTGGKFDGAFGVLAALEAVEAIIACGVRPRRNIEVVSWTNEEGSRFAPGMTGSAGFCGVRQLDEILSIRDQMGIAVETALHKVLSAESRVSRRALGAKPAAFVEAHIEQGPILELEGKTIGIVTGIQGKRTFRIEVAGEENHAGTSPRSVRRDALVSAVDILRALHEALWDNEDVVRLTVGMFNVSPNVPSVVPARVVFSLDLRHPDAARLRALGDAIGEICRRPSGRCAVAVHELLHDPPLEFPLAIRQTVRSAATALHVSCMDMPSGAGHDARHLHYVCPTGMIFIPCKGGISHNEAESILEHHATDGARVLAEVAFALADAE